MEPCAKAEAECPAYVSNDEVLYALETEAGELPSAIARRVPLVTRRGHPLVSVTPRGYAPPR